jgi:hypothetical protein
MRNPGRAARGRALSRGGSSDAGEALFALPFWVAGGEAAPPGPYPTPARNWAGLKLEAPASTELRTPQSPLFGSVAKETAWGMLGSRGQAVLQTEVSAIQVGGKREGGLTGPASSVRQRLSGTFVPDCFSHLAPACGEHLIGRIVALWASRTGASP